MLDFSTSPQGMCASIATNKSLIAKLVKREVVGRYRGSLLGLLWSFLNPLFMLFIYTFVFSVVFKARWGTGSDSQTEFALVLFSGLMVYNLFAECITRSPGIITANANYVKKVVFPLEVLPLVSLGSALFHFMVSFCVWLLAYGLLFGTPSVTAFYFPVILLPLMFFTMGLSWFLASLGVYVRDISQFIGILITTLMFLSPIFYPVTSLPVEYQTYFAFNPMTFIIEQTRDTLIWGKEIHWLNWSYYMTGSLIVSWLGFAWFQKTRKGFADVI